ncbi:MAG: formylglycine-generating enzyme family protein [Proteobacteria bacterium]|nr:formylglycine-generating enzyme family protein [Pseudomonadota bacterium]
MPEFETLKSAVADLGDALRDSNALPPHFPLTEVGELLDAIALLSESSADELPIKLQAAESALSDLRRAYVPRETAHNDDAELPSFAQLRLATSDVMAELRGVLSTLDPVVVAAATPTGDQLSAAVPALENDAILAEIVGDTRQADDEIKRGHTIIIQHVQNYGVIGSISIKLNDLTISNALIRITAKLDMVRLHWLEKLAAGLAKAPDAILKLAKALPLALGAIEIIARELKKATSRIVAHLEQFLDKSKPSPVRRDSPYLSVFRDADWSPEMVVIPAGTFLMGSPEKEDDYHEREGPQHQVTIGRRFALGLYPVTFEDYERYCVAKEKEPPDDRGWGRGRWPVINVSWDDAQAYIKWLNDELDLPGGTYRLPSEAEWEYACRAGTTSRYSFGDDEAKLDAYAWHDGNADGQTHPVGEKLANSWGLFDMHGNVWEWTEDRWHADYTDAPLDGSAWIDGSDENRVLRGGAWFNDPGYLRAAVRYWLGTGNRDYNGFRLARTLSR